LIASMVAKLENTLPEFEGSFTKEPTATEMPGVLTLAEKVSNLKRLRLTRVGVAAK
jgi:hypothetical protein